MKNGNPSFHSEGKPLALNSHKENEEGSRSFYYNTINSVHHLEIIQKKKESFLKENCRDKAEKKIHSF